MPIIVIYTLIALALFGSGFTAAYKLEHTQVIALELQIKLSNEDAQRKQLEAIESTERAELAAAVVNAQLESEHDKAIKLNNDLSNSLATVRMRVTTKRTNCNYTLPTDSGSKTITDSTDTTELPDDFRSLLQSETLRADNLAVYASEAYNFIKSNCGIKR